MGGYTTTQMILVMDNAVLPEHIIQTFRLKEYQRGWVSDNAMLEVLVLGEELDLTVGGYAIVYANNPWHRDKAAELYDQIKALRKDAQIMWLPVEAEVKKPASDLYSFSLEGNNFNPFNFGAKP